MLKKNISKNKIVKHLAGLTLRLVASYQENHNRLAEDIGLTQAEFKCLRLLGSDRKLSNKNFAKRMNLSDSRLTRIVDGLEEKGYMARENDQNDWRSVNLSLTRKGKIFINKLSKHNIEIHHKVLKSIKVSQSKSLIHAMENLISATEKWKWKIK